MHYGRWRKHGDPLYISTATNTRKSVVSYSAAHQRLRADRGTAASHPCFLCGIRAEDWAYVGKDPRGYSEELGEYVPMCRKCHVLVDKTVPTNIERECQACGALFTIKQAELNRGTSRGIYCSNRCTQVPKNSDVDLVCEECGVSFTKKRWEVRQRTGKYCSLTCANRGTWKRRKSVVD